MSARRQSSLPVRLLLGVLMVVPPISFLAAIPWLKGQPDGVVFLLSGIAATLTVVASFFLSVMHDRGLGEWERSNARFSSQWGWTAGACLVALLLALPPFRDVVVSAAADLADAANPNDKLVLVAFTFGFGAVVIAQGLLTTLLSIGWTHWKSRRSRDPS